MPDATFALVTGASSGIGFELARCFVADGHNVVIAADDAEELAAAASTLKAGGNVRVEAIPIDLSRDGGAGQLYAAVRELGIAPDFLAANAGVGVYGDFARETDLDRELAMIRLNVMSTVELVKLVSRDMVTRGKGRILITSSVAALAPSPKTRGLLGHQGLRLRLRGGDRQRMKDTGVTVTALMPDATDTEFFDRADAERSSIAQSRKADPASVAKAATPR